MSNDLEAWMQTESEADIEKSIFTKLDNNHIQMNC